MIDLVDTHCHIQSVGAKTGEKYTRELWAKVKGLTQDKVIENAVAYGVNRLIVVGCDVADSQLAVEFMAGRPNCWASVGIHPHEASQAIKDSSFKDLASLATKQKVVTIGECGLDYHYTHSDKKDQRKVLEYQLELATATNLPVIFHVREAFDDFWPIVSNFPKVQGVLHSYTDSAINLEKGLKRGFYFGVNGIATFTKDHAQRSIYKSIPGSNLLLETDSPFLTPEPYRGNINEPMRVGVIAEFLANLRGEDLTELASITTANARKLFNLV